MLADLRNIYKSINFFDFQPQFTSAFLSHHLITMPQSLSSSMQGYYESDKVVEGVEPHVHASASQQPRLPYFPSYNLGQFLSIEGAPPLGFREPIPIAERINGAKNAIRGFDGQMNKG